MRHSSIRPLAALLVFVLGAAATVAISALAQVVPRAAGTAALQAMPFKGPTTLRLRAVTNFQFAAEIISLGTVPAGTNAHIAVEGTGSVFPAQTFTSWRFEFTRVAIDGQSLSGTAPLATLSIETDKKRPDLTSYAIGFAPPQILPPRSPAHRLLDNVTRALIAGVGDPSSQPLGIGSPVFDLTEGLRRYLTKFMPAVEITDPISPLAAEGVAFHQERLGVLGRTRDAFQLRYGPQAVPLNADATMLDRKSTRLNSSHIQKSRMPSSA